LKKFWKSVKIWQNDGHEFGVQFFAHLVDTRRMGVEDGLRCVTQSGPWWSTTHLAAPDTAWWTHSTSSSRGCQMRSAQGRALWAYTACHAGSQSVSQSRWPRCRDAEQRPPDHPQSRRRYCFDLVREVCRHRRRTSDETKPSRLRHTDREWARNLDQYFGARFTKYLTIILWLSYGDAKVTVDLRRTSICRTSHEERKAFLENDSLGKS